MATNSDITTKAMTFAFKDYIQNGIGADLVRLTSMIGNCDAQGIKLHLARNDKWDHVPDGAEFCGWEYYFQPTERLPIDTRDEYPIIPKDIAEYTKTVLPVSCQSKFEHRSKLMNEIYHPKPEFMEKALQYINNNLPFLQDGKYIAIHVRRGDKTSGPWKEGEAISLKDYLRALREYIGSEDFSENLIDPIIVYVMTDSDDVINEISNYAELYAKSNIIFKWDTNETRRDGYSYKLYKYGYADSERLDEFLTFVKNIHILRGASKIIGSRFSFFFMTAELLRGKKDISLSENKKYPVDFYE